MSTYNKAYYESRKDKRKAYYEAHKEHEKAAMKLWHQIHKEQHKTAMNQWKSKNKDKYKAYQKTYMKAYYKTDVNSLGQTKISIRQKSQRILKRMNMKIEGYQIHHCFTYDDPTKFIYCSKEMHLKIHQFLRDNNIDADSDHYEQIKHLLDDTVIIYGVNNEKD